MLVARGLGRSEALLVTGGLGRAPGAVVQAAVEVYSGGWPEPPDREAVRRQRERMGIIPPAPKSPQRAPQRPTAAPAPEPYEWREPAFDWAAAADLRRLEATLERLAEEALLADRVAAQGIEAALRAGRERRELLRREEEDLAYVLGALAGGLGTPVQVLALQAQADEEGDVVFVIATVAAID